MSFLTLRTRSSYSVSSSKQMSSEMDFDGSQVSRNFSIPPQLARIFFEALDPSCYLDLDEDSSESEFCSFSEFLDSFDSFS